MHVSYNLLMAEELRISCRYWLSRFMWMFIWAEMFSMFCSDCEVRHALGQLLFKEKSRRFARFHATLVVTQLLIPFTCESDSFNYISISPRGHKGWNLSQGTHFLTSLKRLSWVLSHGWPFQLSSDVFLRHFDYIFWTEVKDHEKQNSDSQFCFYNKEIE